MGSALARVEPRRTLRVETPEKFADLYDPPLGAVRYRIKYGGRGSAKSWQFARALLVHGMRKPIRVLCCREYQASMRESVYRVISDMVKRLGLGSFYRLTQTSIIGRNGTEFIFAGLRRDIEQVKSTEGIDVCWVEEAQSVSDTSWETLIPTIRAPGSEIWASFNPGEATEATYKRFVLSPPAPDMIRTKVTWRDNPMFPEVLRVEREKLLVADPEAELHVWDGEPWSRSEAQVLTKKWKVEEFTPLCDRAREGRDCDPAKPGVKCATCEAWGEPLFGADWGFSQDPSVLVKLWRRDSRLWVEYAVGGIQLDADDTEERFREVPGADRYPILADSARPETIREMRNRKLHVIGAEKWDGSVKDGIAHLRDYEVIIIHPRCEMAIRHARLWRYKVDPRSQQVISKLRESNDDTWDAARYALSKIIQRRGGSDVGAWFPGMDGGTPSP